MLAVIWLPALAGAAAAAMFSRPSPVAVGPLMMAALCTLAAGWRNRSACASWPVRHGRCFAPFVLTHKPACILFDTGDCSDSRILRAGRHRASGQDMECSAQVVRTRPGETQGGGWPGTRGVPGRRRVAALRLAARAPLRVHSPVLAICFHFVLVLVGSMACHSASGSWFAWLIARHNTLWLRPLPIRPRALLIAMVAPILLALAGGYFAGFHFAGIQDQSPRSRSKLSTSARCSLGRWPSYSSSSLSTGAG